ncbi:MAG: HAMP domain-containing protein [Xanthobacteraceae bacterium]
MKALKALIADQPSGFTLDTWLAGSVPNLASSLGVATAALDTAKVHAAKQSAMAWDDLVLQASLLVVALVLASSMMLVVSWRVTGPLKAICAAMLKLAGGDFEVVLPGLSRKDEIGPVANAVDEATQRNSALVEENAATAKTLEQQSSDMRERISFFRVDGDAATSRRAGLAAA